MCAPKKTHTTNTPEFSNNHGNSPPNTIPGGENFEEEACKWKRKMYAILKNLSPNDRCPEDVLENDGHTR